MSNCYLFLCNSDFCNYISGLLSFISYFDKMSLKSGLNTKCLHSREQDHLIWKHDFWEETFFLVKKMSNFVFRSSSDNSLRLTKYGVNALASWETIPPSFLQFGSIWVIHTHLLVCFPCRTTGHTTLVWTTLPLAMTKYPKDIKERQNDVPHWSILQRHLPYIHKTITKSTNNEQNC